MVSRETKALDGRRWKSHNGTMTLLDKSNGERVAVVMRGADGLPHRSVVVLQDREEVFAFIKLAQAFTCCVSATWLDKPAE